MDIKFYSFEEISKNNGKDNAKVWIVIKDNVYDVTEYLEEHPGGGDLITEWAGKDGTRAFDDFGHSGDAKKIMKKYKIGEVTEEDRKKKTQKATNGSPKIVEAEISKANRRTCLAIISCGLCG